MNLGSVADWAAVAAAFGAATAAVLQWQSSKYQAKVAAFSVRRAAREKLMSAIRLAAQRSTRNDEALAALHEAWREGRLAFPKLEEPMKEIWNTVVHLVEAEENNDPENSNATTRIALRQRLDQQSEKLAALIDPHVRLDQ